MPLFVPSSPGDYQLLVKQTVPVSVVSGTGEVTLFSYTLPANTIGQNSIILFNGNMTSGTGGLTWRLRINTLLAAQGTLGLGQEYIEGVMVQANSINTTNESIISYATAPQYSTRPLTIGASNLITVSLQPDVGGNQGTLLNMFMSLIP